MTPVVSVILPVYNGEEFLSESIDSVLSQTFKKLELILVDDCSTDATPAICKSYVDQDSRVRYYRNERNLKLPGGLNKGHQIANGKYLTWTSDDNVLYPEHLSVLTDSLMRGNADLVYSTMRTIEANGATRRIVHAEPPVKSLFGSVVGASFLYKREVFEKLKEYDEDKYLIEDFDFWLRASIHFKLEAVEECLYDYRLHSGSLSQRISEDQEFKELFVKRLASSYQVLVNELNFSQVTVDFLVAVHLYQDDTFSIFKKDIKSIIKDLKSYCSKLNADFTSIEPVVINAVRTAWVKDRSLMNRSSLFRVLKYYPKILFSRKVYHLNTVKIIFKSLFTS